MTDDEEHTVAISGPTQHHPFRRSRSRTARLSGLATAGVLALALAGCGGDDAPSASEPDRAGASATVDPDAPRLVQGGEPGQAAQEVPGDTKPPAERWSDDDVTFMSMMIPHHAQALEMTALVPDRAADPRVKQIAERIEASQGPEIQMMAAWLDQRELEVPTAEGQEDHGAHGDHGGHGGHEMAGMLTDAQMEQLAAASGPEFDRLFLTAMIRHHEGALEMADETAGGGLDVIVGEHRDGVTSDQSTEVARMRTLLESL